MIIGTNGVQSRRFGGVGLNVNIQPGLEGADAAVGLVLDVGELGMAAVEPAQVGTAIEFFPKLVPMDALSASAVTIEDGQSVMPLTAQIGAGESKQ